VPAFPLDESGLNCGCRPSSLANQLGDRAAICDGLGRESSMLVAAIPFPLGPPPRAPWNRHTQQPVTAGARQRSRVRFEVAVQRGLSCIATPAAYSSLPRAAFYPPPASNGS